MARCRDHFSTEAARAVVAPPIYRCEKYRQTEAPQLESGATVLRTASVFVIDVTSRSFPMK